jgi:cytochrome c oxidase subunit 1
MFAQGMAGMHRRMYDGGVTYSLAQGQDVVGALSDKIIRYNINITHAAFGLLIFQLPFIFNFFYSIVKGKKVTSDNPWQATTLDWQTPTPPPHGNFTETPEVFRGPYDYSTPGAKSDFIPQNQKA